MTHALPSTAQSVQLVENTETWAGFLFTDRAIPAPAVFEVPGVSWRGQEDTGILRVPANALRTLRLQHLVQRPAVDETLYEPTRALYAHQRVAARRALRTGCQIIADEMGLGKTTTAAAAAENIRRARKRCVLIVAPGMLRETWRAELDAMGYLEHPDNFLALTGAHGDASRIPPAHLERARFIFCHYEIVRFWQRTLLSWRPCAAILDEAHFANNPRSLRGKAALMATSMAACRLILTGTPILNRVSELWHLLTLATGPRTWGTHGAFRIRYASATSHVHGGLLDGPPSHVEELQERMSDVYIRRRLTDIDVKLPPLRRQTITVSMSERQERDYAELLQGRSIESVRAAIEQQRAGTKTIEWLAALREIASLAKEPGTVELAQSMLAQEEQVVIFTWKRATAERIVSKLSTNDGAATFVHGGLPMHEREARIQLFRAGTRKVLVATFGALGVGVTLTSAARIIIHDLDYVPAVMLQAEARVHRLTQQRPTTSYWMVAAGTIDAIITRLIVRKADAISAALEDDAPQGLLEVLTEEERVELFDTVDKLRAWAR